MHCNKLSLWVVLMPQWDNVTTEGFVRNIVVQRNRRRCSGGMVLHVTCLLGVSVAIFGTCNFWTENPDVEDCSRVLTTSNGHVTIAPTVPAVL